MELQFTDTHVSFGGRVREIDEASRAELESIQMPSGNPTAEQLLDVGRRLFDWLDGDGRWLRELPDEIVVRVDRDAPLSRAPWEVLADAEGHLAARRISIVRRLRDADRTQPEPDGYRLGVLFMAAAPEGGGAPLRYEDEEAAILRAVREPGQVMGVVDPESVPETMLDLFAEDTGHLPDLIDRLDVLRTHAVDVLHISAHGSASPEPVLRLETIEGRPERVSAQMLADRLRRHLAQLPLAVVSACETAGDGLASSVAHTLIREGGARAVLAWSGKVGDADATVFAAWLYHYLARGERLDSAVAHARADLMRHPTATGRVTHWYQARLVLGALDGGELATAGGRARRLPAPRLPYDMANTSGRARPVCHPAAFVGRRAPMRQALRALRTEGAAGVVVTGVGQQGKSSFAFRLCDRLRDRNARTVVHWGRLDDVTV